ncbi:MAG: Uma2 family endonuclease [Myxococcales bacterium]|nr:Uma2 family endonuclease [Myxococcales bacterium]
MGEAAKKSKLTYAEYLALEEASEGRHEFIDGEAYAMAGGTSRHAVVGANVIAALAQALRGRRCFPVAGSQRIRVPATGGAFYADATVVCDRYVHADDDPDGLTNPTVIVEVLSPSTQDYDRGEKFEHYRLLPSLQHYLLVTATEQSIQHRQRTGDGWRITYHTDGALHLAALGIDLALDDVYANLDMVDGPAAE